MTVCPVTQASRSEVIHYLQMNPQPVTIMFRYRSRPMEIFVFCNSRTFSNQHIGGWYESLNATVVVPPLDELKNGAASQRRRQSTEADPWPVNSLWTADEIPILRLWHPNVVEFREASGTESDTNCTLRKIRLNYNVPRHSSKPS